MDGLVLLLSGQAKYERAEERSEEHTSELQSQSNLVCRLLLEKKKQATVIHTPVSLLDKSAPSYLVRECHAHTPARLTSTALTEGSPDAIHTSTTAAQILHK